MEGQQQRDASESLTSEKGFEVSHSPEEELADVEGSEGHVTVMTSLVAILLHFLEHGAAILLQVEGFCQLIFRENVQ